jgi:hypothetical protein
MPVPFILSGDSCVKGPLLTPWQRAFLRLNHGRTSGSNSTTTARTAIREASARADHIALPQSPDVGPTPSAEAAGGLVLKKFLALPADRTPASQHLAHPID